MERNEELEQAIVSEGISLQGGTPDRLAHILRLSLHAGSTCRTIARETRTAEARIHGIMQGWARWYLEYMRLTEGVPVGSWDHTAYIMQAW